MRVVCSAEPLILAGLSRIETNGRSQKTPWKAVMHEDTPLTIFGHNHKDPISRIGKPGLSVIGLLAAMALMLAYAAYFDNGPLSIYDDSYISFRYANNLARGEGLVFNPAQPVEGYTNFLWTVLLAGAISLGFDVIWVSKALAAVIGLVTLWLAFDLARFELDSRWAGVLVAVMLAASAGFSRYVVSGMETLLFAMLILAGVLLFLHARRSGKNPVGAAFLLALAALTRPEGLMVFGLVSVFYLADLWKQPGPAGKKLLNLCLWSAGFLVIIGPYFVWRYTYYGYWLPNTFYVKVGGPGAAQVRRGLIYLRDVLLLLNPQVALCLLLGLAWRGNKFTVRLLYGLVLTYLLYLLLIGGDQQAFFGARFVLPLFPFTYVLGIGGVLGLAARLSRPSRRLLWFGFLSLLVCLFVFWSRFERMGYRRLQDTMQLGWTTAAHWLKDQANPGDTLAVDAAGYIPFYTGLPTVDMMGLNDLHIAHMDVPLGSGLPGHEKADPAYVLAQRPAYIASWLTENGRSLYFADAPAATRTSMETACTLRAVFLMRPPENGERQVIEQPAMNENLQDRGYIFGIFKCNWGKAQN